MEGLLDALAENISDDKLIDMMEDAIRQHRSQNTERTKGYITFIASMLLRQEVLQKVGHEKLNEHRQAFAMGERIMNSKN